MSQSAHIPPLYQIIDRQLLPRSQWTRHSSATSQPSSAEEGRKAASQGTSRPTTMQRRSTSAVWRCSRCARAACWASWATADVSPLIALHLVAPCAQMLKHGRAGVPLEVMGLMLGDFVDEYTVRVIGSSRFLPSLCSCS